ncbi:hypothetical protein [Kordiimonas aestuarii]|uniref:hypothetical protein n=1 Tax=Kordiimonas aestuarii TaxID=1005925 RepID=UPI0021CE9AEA|nr:hypothetical protein [Kordiimonas aestuarii]
MQTPKLIILSGAYCSAEIVAEFGKIPPAFLPLGTRRLYELQLEIAAQLDAEVILTIPESYEVDPWDQDILDAQLVSLLRAPSGLNLSQAVNYALSHAGADEKTYLLYGDTLITGEVDEAADWIATGQTTEYYEWAFIDHDSGHEPVIRSRLGDGRSTREVVCGFFAFSDPQALLDITSRNDDFIGCLNEYAAVRPFSYAAAHGWYDFGHLPLIYRSKRKMLTSRAFNDITSDGISITKTSRHGKKMKAEAAWFQNLPREIKPFVPQFFGETEVDGRAGYCLEYLYQPTLAELFVFGRLPTYVWRHIITKCTGFLSNCRAIRPPEGHPFHGNAYANTFHQEVYVNKTYARVTDFCKQRSWDEDDTYLLNGTETPSLNKISADLLAQIQKTTPAHICLWHGDFFFGNTFFDFRSRQIKIVDPRGAVTPDNQSIYGDYRYDLAKLAHSIVGCYDYLLVGRASFEEHAERNFSFKRPTSALIDFLQQDLAESTVEGKPVIDNEILAIMALLFITMLPLHNDDARRQSIMLANALQIHRDLMETER